METLPVGIWIAVASFLFSTVTGIGVYVWKQRSSRTDRFMEKLDETMTLVTDRLARIETSLGTVLSQYIEVQKRTDEQEKRIAQLESRLAALEAVLKSKQ